MRFPSALEGKALASAQLVSGLIETMLDAVWVIDAARLRVLAANTAAGTLSGRDAEELCGHDILELCATPEDLLFWSEAASGDADGIESHTWLRRADGHMLPVVRRVSRLWVDDSEAFVVVLHDRSEQCRTEEVLEERAAELAATLESTADGLLVTDLSGNVRHFNRAFAALWDVPPMLRCRRDDDALLGAMLRMVADPGSYMRRLAALDSAELLEAVDTVPLHGGRVLQRVSFPQTCNGVVIGRVYSFRDVSGRLAASRRIDVLSHSDSLTGLPTRGVLAERVQSSIALAQRTGTPFALLLVNLDRFKQVNDALGHELGDRVLVDVSARLGACVRQADTVARLGGDEFVVLAHEADLQGAGAAARRILQAMQEPFTQGGMSFPLSCSIGVALYPSHGQQPDELVRNADVAMRQVKSAGRAAYRVHEAQARVDEGPRGPLRLDMAMRQALQFGHFRLHYQPQVDTQSGCVRGAEALIRWHDPELGNVPPAEFIPLAEESGFIVAIGDWVLQQAVAQAALWRAQGRNLVMCINVSAVQFNRAGFVDRVAQALQREGLPPELLELEITESILIQDAQQALVRLQALSDLGVKLAIDDFGTGYSSLGYLKRFPIDRLKIDRSFVRGLPLDASDVGIVNAIVNLGRALHLEIVAEGVETEAQRQFLLTTGCEQFQGFLFSPALDSASFEQRVDAISANADR